MDLEEAQQQQIDAVTDGYKTARWGTPITITAASGAVLTIPSDEATQLNIVFYLTAHDAMATPPSAFPLQDNAGISQTLAYSDLQALVAKLYSNATDAWTKLQTLLAEISEATDVESVLKIQW